LDSPTNHAVEKSRSDIRPRLSGDRHAAGLRSTGQPRAGRVDLFADPKAAQRDFTLPLPGGVGSRNVLRGNGYAEWDMSLYKSWQMPYRETHSGQFRWDVFNVPNLTRFNAQSVGSSALLTSLAQQATNFGAYTSLLT
jgi:hypothetical protein